MPPDTATYVTAEEYLAAERDATLTRHEWIDGETREMTGATFSHNVIVGLLVKRLGILLEGRPLAVCPNDMKVRVPDGPYYYPDVVVVPNPPEFEGDRRDIVRNPLVLIEVLSPSTEEYDRGEKLDEYRRIPSLVDYLLVERDECRIDHHTRRNDGRWGLAIHRDPAATVRLDSIACDLLLRDVYDRVLDGGT